MLLNIFTDFFSRKTDLLCDENVMVIRKWQKLGQKYCVHLVSHFCNKIALSG